MLIAELQNAAVESIQLDEAVMMLSVARLLSATYSDLKLPQPDWLKDKTAALQKEVAARHRDYLERALKNAKMRSEALKTRDQKASDVAAEIAALEAQLNG